MHEARAANRESGHIGTWQGKLRKRGQISIKNPDFGQKQSIGGGCVGRQVSLQHSLQKLALKIRKKKPNLRPFPAGRRIPRGGERVTVEGELHKGGGGTRKVTERWQGLGMVYKKNCKAAEDGSKGKRS